MTEKEISDLVKAQREYFFTNETLSIKFRKAALKRLQKAIKSKEDKISEALKKDLGKSAHEGFMCETGLVLSEISYMLKRISRYSRAKTVPTPLTNFHSTSKVKPSPYGVTLIMSPWNYPFLLTIEPLVDSLAAGNTAIVKPSAYSPNTSAIIETIIKETFEQKYVATVTGGREENKALLKEKFDYIFFTGSQAVGKEVMKAAGEHLTPVTLELGGKSPCIIHKDANIKLAAKRLVFGKFLNCGQTCVAPDYVLCHKDIKEKFIAEVKNQIIKQYGENPLSNPDYGKIINEKHFNRVSGLINREKIVHGGKVNAETQQIEPTVMDNVTYDDAVMQEEIFGPLMPVLTFDSIEQIIGDINSKQCPLALYIFTSASKIANQVTSQCRFGGGCVNDTVLHLATSSMGFGGCGESGMGAYHGKAGFDTFSHHKSILHKYTWIDMPMRYQPYQKIWDNLIHFLLK